MTYRKQADVESRLTSHAESCFDPGLYTSLFYDDRVLKDNTLNVVQWYLNEFYASFKDGLIRGKRLLDVGSGPVVGPVIPAARWHDEIYLSDKWKCNTDLLEKWRRGESDHMKPLMEYFVRNDGSQCNDTLNQQLVGKIRGILELDLIQKEPFKQTNLENTVFDTITAGICLQVASSTIDEFRTILLHLRNLLVPGGHLVVSDVIDQSSYSVGEMKFIALSANQSELMSAFQECGFEIEQWKTKTFTLEQPSVHEKCNIVYTAVMRKK